MRWGSIGKKSAAVLLAATLAFCQPATYACASNIPTEPQDIHTANKEAEDHGSVEENDDLNGIDGYIPTADNPAAVEHEPENADPSGQPDDVPEPEATPGEPDDTVILDDDAEEQIIARSKTGEPYYEITRAPDLEYGTMTVFNSGLVNPKARSAQTPRKISTLNVNDTVMVPLANTLTLKFRVMAKDHYQYGPGVILMSTQTTATVKYEIGTTMNGPNTFVHHHQANDMGAYINSLARDYLINTFYNELHSKLKPLMKRAAQGEEYIYWWWGYGSHSGKESDAKRPMQCSTNDLVFIPSTYEVSRNIDSSHVDFGNTWGPNTTWSISNSSYFHLRDRIGSNNYKDLATGVAGHNDGYFLAMYVYAVESSGNTVLTKAGCKPSDDKMVYEIMVPCILLDNNTMVIDGANGTEITFNSPPTTPGAVSAPSSVNKWQSGTVSYSWGASTDPDGDAVAYVLEYAINGDESYTHATNVSGTSYSLTIPVSNPGSIRLRVKARDSQGAESAYSYSGWTTIVHNSPPTTPPGMNGAASINSWSHPNAVFSWNASTDPNGDPITYAVEESVNGGDYTSVQNTEATGFSHPVNIPGDNAVQIRVRAFDGKLYSDYCYSGVTAILHDIEAPTIQLMSSPDAATGWVRGEITITAILTDALSGLKTLFVPNGVTPGGDQTLSGKSATKSFKTMENGIYPFTVADNAGNSASASIEIPMVDNEPPTLEYSTSTPDGQFTNMDVTINLTLGDTLSGLSEYVSPDGSESISGNIAHRTFTAAANSVYPFTVIDAVGNISSKNIRINMIDRIKPVITMNPRLSQWTNADYVEMDISASDDYSGVLKIILPDGSEHTDRTETSCVIYENGVYSTTATDRAGNISDAATVNYQWFDRTSPTITSLRFAPVESLMQRFSSWFGNLVSNRSVQMELSYDDTPSGSDGESGVNWIYHRIFNSAGDIVEDWTATPAGADMPRIDSEMNGYVEVFVEDAAGNRSEAAVFEILIDKTPPETAYTVSETEITNRPVTATLTAADEAGGSGFKGWLLPVGGVLAAQPQIDYIFTENAVKTFVALDNAGNRTDVVIAVGNIDLHPPVINSIDIEEVTEGGILGAFANMFVKASFNTKIRVTVNAADDIAVDKILFLVTPGADISNDAEWLAMDGNSVEFEQEMSGVFHAKAVDKARNESETVSRAIIIDRSPPALSYELKGRENEYEPIIIQVTATDDTSAFGVSGISHITNPTGKVVQDSYMEYTADKNGSYIFTASDHAGNKTSLIVEIDGISEVMPADFEGNRPVIDAVLHATGKRAINEVSYSDLLNITYLDMSSKGLVSAPGILKYAKNISHLDLRGNELQEVPEFVYSLHSLRRLDLSNNNLSAIDEKLGGLRNLETLDISLNYLIDYDCPLIIPDYRAAGNYTMEGRAGQYSFEFREPESAKEYAGNTATLLVEWSYGGQPVENGLESHRKALYSAFCNDYRSYRPAIHEYRVENGQIKHSNADYAQIYMPHPGVMSAGYVVGDTGVLSETSGCVDVLGLPEPEISGFDAVNGIVFLRAAGLDTAIKANIRAAVSALDMDGVLETSDVRVNDPDNIKVPLKMKFQKGQTVTAMLINHDISGIETDAVNESNGNVSSEGNCGQSGSGGSHTTTVEYIIIGATPNEVIVEKIVEVEKPENISGETSPGSGSIQTENSGFEQDDSEIGYNAGAGDTSGQGSGGYGNAEESIVGENTDNEGVIRNLCEKIMTPVGIPVIFIPAIVSLPLFRLIFSIKKRKRDDEREKH